MADEKTNEHAIDAGAVFDFSIGGFDVSVNAATARLAAKDAETVLGMTEPFSGVVGLFGDSCSGQWDSYIDASGERQQAAALRKVHEQTVFSGILP
ncbi:hypothetical protein [Rhizobium sp. BR 362]|uniref:hypothetical protein n=1 Tax=Rhizobium sp. BR 362 TaxID=3040670 RepID=UPI002F3E583C